MKFKTMAEVEEYLNDCFKEGSSYRIETIYNDWEKPEKVIQGFELTLLGKKNENGNRSSRYIWY